MDGFERLGQLMLLGLVFILLLGSAGVAGLLSLVGADFWWALAIVTPIFVFGGFLWLTGG